LEKISDISVICLLDTNVEGTLLPSTLPDMLYYKLEEERDREGERERDKGEGNRAEYSK
jgi:hypothetical protein